MDYHDNATKERARRDLRLLGTVLVLMLLLGCVAAYTGGQDDLMGIKLRHQAKVLETANEANRQDWIASCLQERFPSWEDNKEVIKAGVKTCIFTAGELYPPQDWRAVAKAQEKKRE